MKIPFGLFILPLLGGYWFAAKCFLTKAVAAQYDGHRLIFQSATAGLAFLIAARLLSAAFVEITYKPEYFEWLPAFSNPETVSDFCNWLKTTTLDIKKNYVNWDYIGTTSLAFFLGPFCAFVVNTFLAIPGPGSYLKQRWYWNTIEEHGDELEQLLAIAFHEKLDVMLTLKNGKVYVGQLTGMPADLTRNKTYIKITPLWSGHRESDLRVEETTNYRPLLGLKKFDNPKVGQYRDFTDKIIPKELITACSLWDRELWRKFKQINSSDDTGGDDGDRKTTPPSEASAESAARAQEPADNEVLSADKPHTADPAKPSEHQ